jgi:hypothetical protein
MAEHDRRFKQLLKEFFPERRGSSSGRSNGWTKTCFPPPPQGGLSVLECIEACLELDEEQRREFE